MSKNEKQFGISKNVKKQENLHFQLGFSPIFSPIDTERNRPDEVHMVYEKHFI